MKVLFIIPKFRKSRLGKTAAKGYLHMGIAYLTAVLKHNDIEVQILDETGEQSNREALNFAKDSSPDLVGITICSQYYRYALDTIERVKTNIDCPIVVGGPHISAVGKQALLDTKADFAVKGEGEHTLLELISELGNSRPDFSRIDGLIWRNKQEIVENKDRAWIQDLDSLPFPDFEAFQLEKYKYPLYTSHKGLPLVTSRGCPYRCIFCSVRLSMGQRFRARSPENVVDEIEYWHKKGWDSFVINDDCFNFDTDRAIRICDLILERQLKISYQLGNGIRADRTSEELLQKIKQSGCFFVSYGCESGNETTLKAMKKGLKLDDVRRAIDWSNKVGIRTSVNFTIGHPGETYETAMDSIRFAKALPATFVEFWNLIPYPGTELFEWVKQNANLLVPMDSYLLDVSEVHRTPIYETAEFTSKERKRVLKRGFALAERTSLQSRLGSFLGYLVYLITRLRILAKIGGSFALQNKVGIKIFTFLSHKFGG